MNNKVPHKSVLINEVIHYLNPQPGKTYLDVTFGAGGHTRALLDYEPNCSVIAMDWDTASLDTYGIPLQEEYGERLQLIWGNFALLYKIVKKEHIKKVDGILADFGTSQMQLAERAGFSFLKETPLDMRMSPSHHHITAADVVNQASEKELREILWLYAEEKHAKVIAHALVQAREQRPITSTTQLAQIVERVVPRTGNIHPATRLFQALRIVVNKELDNIHSFLAEAPRVLTVGGRLVCISFHSLEDRIVKQHFKQEERKGILNILTPKVVTPSEEELQKNPSSRSACLRAAELVSQVL